MSPWIKVMAAAMVAAAPFGAMSAERAALACTVTVDYVLNNVVAESYNKDFTVDLGAGFVDDFSSNLRQKRFAASTARESGNQVVSIDYFNDVGVFHAIGFSTRLTLASGRNMQTTSGSNSFSTSLGVAGNHVTNYTLTCRR